MADPPSPEFADWERMLDDLRSADRALFAVLADCGLVRFERAGVTLATSRRGFTHRQLGPGSEFRATLDGALTRRFGGAVEVELREQDPCLPDVPSLSLVRQNRRAVRRREVRSEAEANPEIRRLIQDFDGQLHGVEPI